MQMRVIVTTISEWVDGCNVYTTVITNDGAFAPSIVSISGNNICILVCNFNNITLQVLIEIVRCIIIDQSTYLIEIVVWHTCGRFTVDLQDAHFWMPRNYGGPALYEIRAELRYRGELADAVGFRLGVRTVELERTSIAASDGS